MRLGEWLSKHGLGQQEFAARIGISQGQVSKLVRGVRGKRLSTEIAVAIERATDGEVPVSVWVRKRRRRPARRSSLHHQDPSQPSE